PRRARRSSRRARRRRRASPCGRPPKSDDSPGGSCGEDGFAHPLLLVEEATAKRESLLGLRAVASDDVLELGPVGLGVLPDAVVAPAQLRVGNGEAELADLRAVPLEELLARLLVPLRLDPPQVHRILVGGDRVPVELHQRAPPAVERLLYELELLGRARDH